MAVEWGSLLGMPGDTAGWSGGIAQASVPVTDLSPHVDGGQSQGTSAAANMNAGSSITTLHDAVGVVLAAIILLYLMGALVFKGSNH